MIAELETIKRAPGTDAKIAARRKRLFVGVAACVVTWCALGFRSVWRADEREIYSGSKATTVFIDGQPSGPGRICSRRYGAVFVAPAAGAALCWRILAERPDMLFHDPGRRRTTPEPLRFALEIEGREPYFFTLDEPSAWREIVVPLNFVEGQTLRWTITVERLFRPSRWTATATPCFSYGFTLDRNAPQVMTSAQLEQRRAAEKNNEIEG